MPATAKSKPPRAKIPDHPWRFPSHFRRNAFGRKASRLAGQRLKEAVSEIKAVARKDGTLGAEGAVRLIERLSPALEHIESSSGAIGTAVNRAIEELVPVIAGAPADTATRQLWLERLFQAHADDGIPYIETLADWWGELCVTKELAGLWADELLEITRMALGPDKSLRGHFHGATACLSSLLRAERYAEIEEMLRSQDFWHYRLWMVKALAAQGRPAEAIELAESSRGPWTSDTSVNLLCEEILLSSGLVEDAYRRYGLYAHRAGTYLATFRAVARRYPSKMPADILADLVGASPGDEGKWFATAKDLKLYDLALALARRGPCDPKTLARAARDFVEREPTFAREVGIAALHWLAGGQGYDLTALDVWGAYTPAMKPAEQLGTTAETRKIVSVPPNDASRPPSSRPASHSTTSTTPPSAQSPRPRSARSRASDGCAKDVRSC